MKVIATAYGQRHEGDVTFLHEREHGEFGEVLPHGGKTHAEICFMGDDAGGIIYTGIARCSQRDNFSRRMGRTIALGRAVKSLRSEGFAVEIVP